MQGLFSSYMDSVSRRTISEQLEISKKASDFVAFLAGLAFLAAIQSFTNIELKNAGFYKSIPLLFAGVFIFFTQFYLSYTVSTLLSKLISGFFNRLSPPENRDMIEKFIAVGTLLFVQIMYFSMFNTIMRMAEKGIG